MKHAADATSVYLQTGAAGIRCVMSKHWTGTGGVLSDCGDYLRQTAAQLDGAAVVYSRVRISLLVNMKIW